MLGPTSSSCPDPSLQEGQPTTVFTSATFLIHQTNMVMITVKDKCE